MSAVARYGGAILFVLVAHVIVAAAHGKLGPAISSIFLAAVILSSFYGGLGPGLAATVLAALDLDYTFMLPLNSFSLVFEDVLWLTVFITVSISISSLQGRRLRAEKSLRLAHAELEQRVQERTIDLTRSREEFAMLVNGVAEQAVFMLGTDARVMGWNLGAERLLGYRTAEAVGKHISEICALPGRWEWHLDRVVSMARSRYQDQQWVGRRDGSQFWASVVFTPVHDDHGQARGYAISIHDISERRSLERDIIEISEREQRRIGHDLHDGLGQELSGISLLSTALADHLESISSDASKDAEEVADLVRESIAHARDLARGLCPVDLEDDGLASALKRLAASVSRLPSVHCTCDAVSGIHLDSVTASHFYRIAQEAINNAIRHGGARQIKVLLCKNDDDLALIVTDDGCGFSPETATLGMGLRLMNYRARLIRGVFDVRHGDQSGMIVECRVTDARSKAYA